MCPGRPRPCERLRLVVVPLLVVLVAPTAASAASAFHRDRTPLPADISGGTAAKGAVQAAGATGGGAAFRMLIGLAIVLALIFGLYKLVKRAANKNDKTVRHEGGMTVLATTPLAPSRSLHLVSVGEELVLVGVSEQSVTPIRVYSAEEARKLRVDQTGGPGAMVPLAGPTDGRPGFGAAFLKTLRERTAR
jgi:flagellar biosynthetic protein FliO